MKHWYLILLFVFPTFIHAKDKTISLSHLKPYEARFNYYIVEEEGIRAFAGTWTDKVLIAGDDVIRTVVRKPVQKSMDLIRVVSANRHTLYPNFLKQKFGDNLEGFYYSEFNERKLFQFYTPDDLTSSNHNLTEFENQIMETNLQGLFAVSLATQELQEINVNAYIAGKSPGVKAVKFLNQGLEKIEVMGELMTTKRIHEPASNWTYWVRNEAPYLVKVLHPSADGKLLMSEVVEFQE